MNRSINNGSWYKGIAQQTMVTASIAAAVVAALAIGTGTAHAQSTNATPKPARVDLGIGFPTSGTVTNATDSTDFSGGIAYDLLGTKGLTGQSFRGGLYGDFATIEKHSNQFTTIGGGVEGRAYVLPRTSAYQPYVGLGLGAYSVKYKETGLTNETDTKFGGKFALGLDTPSGFFVEANYTLIDKVKVDGDKIDPSGTNLAVGYKF